MEVHGLDELLITLKENVTMDDVKKIIKTNGVRLTQEMKRQTTGAYVKGYSTGDTASSINMEIRDNGMSVAVGSTMNYTPYVEFGTRYMKAEPVVVPALLKVKPNYLRDLNRIIKK